MNCKLIFKWIYLLLAWSVQELVSFKINYGAVGQDLFQGFDVIFLKYGMLLVKDYVRYVNGAGPFVFELLFELEKAIFDLLFNI